MNALLVSIILSVLPSFAIIVLFFGDAPGRKRYIVAFVAGFFAVLPALFVELLVSPAITFASHVGNSLFRAFIIAALVENTTKLLLIRLLAMSPTPSRREIDNIGENGRIIRRAALIAAGFAAFENVVYSAGDVGVALLRGLTSVPLHVSVTVLMAWTIIRSRNLTAASWLGALSIGVLLHGSYDFVLFLGGAVSWSAIPLAVVATVAAIRRIALTRPDHNLQTD